MFKKLVNRSLSILNLQLVRKSRFDEEKKVEPDPFVYFDFDLVFDVGANEGQYARSLRSKGFRKKIISFEPLPEAHQILNVKSQSDPLWVVHERVAIGARCGKSLLNISGNSMSSSILNMLPTHLEAAPESRFVGVTPTDLISLDSVFTSYVRDCLRVAVKIDTQGYEFEVISGLVESLPRISGCVLELSTLPLYENERTYEWFFDFFQKNGFVLWSIKPGFNDCQSGRMLQFDACFLKDKLVDCSARNES